MSHFQGGNHSKGSFGAIFLKMFFNGPYLSVLAQPQNETMLFPWLGEANHDSDTVDWQDYYMVCCVCHCQPSLPYTQDVF